MKKILILVFLFICAKGFTQSPILQNLGSDSSTVQSKGPFSARKGLINGIYPDTATANLQHISQYASAQISVHDTIWLRDSTKTKWIPLGGGKFNDSGIVHKHILDTIDSRKVYYGNFNLGQLELNITNGLAITPTAIAVDNANSVGTGINVYNSGSSGKGILVGNDGTGTGLVVNNYTGATGYPFVIQNNGFNTFYFKPDGRPFYSQRPALGFTDSLGIYMKGQIDSLHALSAQLAGTQSYSGINTFNDTTKQTVVPLLTDSSTDALNTAWIQQQYYLKSTAPFPNQAVPFGNGTRTLTYDATGLYYDGSNLWAGHSGFGLTDGLMLNGGRAALWASGFGATFSTQGGTPMDASKSITFENSSTPYMVMHMASTSDSNMVIDFKSRLTDTYLKTTGASPTQTGTIKMMTTDDNGVFGFTSIGSVSTGNADSLQHIIGTQYYRFQTDLISQDLNTITTTGWYSQGDNSNTSTSLNYPDSLSGKLEVHNADGGTFIYQAYHTYSIDNSLYFRSKWAGSWSAWKKAIVADTSGSVTLDTYGAGLHTGTPLFAANFDVNGKLIEGPVSPPTTYPAIPSGAINDGTTATTQSLHDSTDKVATDKFAMQNFVKKTDTTFINLDHKALFPNATGDTAKFKPTNSTFDGTHEILYDTTSGTFSVGTIASTKISGLTTYVSDSLNNKERGFWKFLGVNTKANLIYGGIENFTSTSSPTSGTQYRYLLYVPKYSTISGVRFFLATQGAYNAGNYNGFKIYSLDTSSGGVTMIDSTANDTALFKSAANVWVSKSFISSHALAAGVYAIAMLYTNNGTQPTAPTIGIYAAWGNGNTGGNQYVFPHGIMMGAVKNSETYIENLNYSSFSGTSVRFYSEYY